MNQLTFKKHLSIGGMLCVLQKQFKQIDRQAIKKKNNKISLTDYLMSAFAIFSLKSPSLLSFDQSRLDPTIAHNIKALYNIQHIPCDTALRECLDQVSPQLLRPAFTNLFSLLQRGKVLENYTYLDGHYLLSIDGTGYFSSSHVHCDNCCKKQHRDGSISYYHQMLSAVLVHPEHKEVFPLAPEPILKQDGVSKNDCESNASKRLLLDFRREHPHLKCIVVEDSLASNGPHITLLNKLNCRFILGAKDTNLSRLFNEKNTNVQTNTYEWVDEKGCTHRFKYLNDAPLNNSQPDVKVNFVEYWEDRPATAKKESKTLHFSWVTDIEINEDNLMQIMRAGRARWRIENETFNTLKNQGYHFEHNFGHGYKHLSTVFAFMMLLAFLVDQIQQHCCQYFQAAVKKQKYKCYFWQQLKGRFTYFRLHNWEMLFKSMVFQIKAPELTFYDTS